MRELERLEIKKALFGILFVLGVMLLGVPGKVWATAGDAVADRVLGQPNCSRSAPNTVDPEAMNQPNAVAIDKSVSPNRLYIADTSNNRVLGYSSISALVNGGSANLVIGQPDLFSSNGGNGPSSLNGPKAVAVDKLGNLYVADTGNNRVLEFAKPFSSGVIAGQAAIMVWGQALSFNSGSCNLNGPATAETMCQPSGVVVDGNGNLFVADSNNNRVLAFKVPFNAATDADKVYGQSGNFTGSKCNLGSTTPSATTLCSPGGLAVDATNNLYVADTGNNRVLKFNTPLTNTTANLSFGQLGLFVLNGCNQGGTPTSGPLAEHCVLRRGWRSMGWVTSLSAIPTTIGF